MLSPRRLAVAALAFALSGPCGATQVTVPKATTDVPSAGKFPHARFGVLLGKVVKDGLVDYEALEKDTSILDEYLAEVARVSPESHPHLFPTEDDRLTYYLNVHNACALKGVLVLHRPANLAGVAHRLDRGLTFTVGGKSRSLLDLVDFLRKRFPEPRVHFVLSRGRRGGPPLLSDAIDPKSVDETLEKAARAFLNDPKNVESDPKTLTVRLSRLLVEYRADFERQTPHTISGDGRFLAALNRWRAPAAGLVGTHVEALPFDERLNDVSEKPVMRVSLLPLGRCASWVDLSEKPVMRVSLLPLGRCASWVDLPEKPVMRVSLLPLGRCASCAGK